MERKSALNLTKLKKIYKRKKTNFDEYLPYKWDKLLIKRNNEALIERPMFADCHAN